MADVAVITDLAVKHNSTPVLQGISFSLARHSMLAILGPNGGGKSTLLKALAGLVPYTGTIRWNETSISYLPSLDQINRKELPPLTVEDFFRFKKYEESWALDLLGRVGLDPALRSRHFDALSTGEFQRMLIAWTLLEKPAVVLLDEPSAGLDVKGEHMIFSFLKAIPTMTVLIATHHVHSALEYADQLLCINKEQICYGPPHEVTPDTIKSLYGHAVRNGHR